MLSFPFESLLDSFENKIENDVLPNVAPSSRRLFPYGS
jgi:hypothetical protein